ncbi:hypothetical protein KUTeg_001690 [Tegillarca granosa]|uniref:Uncharacterized protein n=1 Tax=Tegillarca granosa TaxID=220873 RepID=A0ABQ9FS61_TEGGR|nr:hypothetical protein KUTeg_001690 [Tegillarca granosa]
MFITDRLIAKRYLAVSTVRKLFLIFGKYKTYLCIFNLNSISETISCSNVCFWIPDDLGTKNNAQFLLQHQQRTFLVDFCLIRSRFVGSSPFILWVSFLGKESRDLIVVLIVIYWTVQSTTNAGFRVNHLDIAPKYV